MLPHIKGKHQNDARKENHVERHNPTCMTWKHLILTQYHARHG